jgi:hypothetical protein
MDTDRIGLRANQDTNEILAEGYRRMTDDLDRELEAEEWIEALIADAVADEGYGL